ncbi:uncharacterized protein LOC126766009 [Bactrocera neohumeralis]|uniref:uncharacterized protein LOC126766009 n=1 Tax=Bactrocera neohumeralis TaxID=98809 RepID=UPI002165E528|nr:uncharacterized protein LOC126766009 [Bactrocera neohumeralis]
MENSTKVTVKSQQPMLVAMQKQINALSNQLRGTQVKLKESERQCKLLKSTIQVEDGSRSNSIATSVDPVVDTATQPIAVLTQTTTNSQNSSNISMPFTSAYTAATHTYTQCPYEGTTSPIFTATATSIGTMPSTSLESQPFVNGGHTTRDCRRRKTCRMNGCQRIHNKLLHEPPRNMSKLQRVEIPPGPTTADAVLSCTDSGMNKQKVLFRIVPVTVHSHKARIKTFAPLVEGSSITMADSSLIEQLGVKGHQSRVSLQWLGGRAATDNATIVDIEISGSSSGQKYKLHHVYGIQDLQLPIQSLQKADVDEARLKRLSIQTYDNAVHKLLMGLDHSHLGIPSKIETLRYKGPYAAHTKLGWVVFGPTDNFSQAKTSCLHMSVSEDKYLHDMVADYSSIESFGVRPAPLVEPDDDKRARQILESTVTKINGRFQAGLLWKRDSVQLPDSYSMAERRLVGIKRSRLRNTTARDYRQRSFRYHSVAIKKRLMWSDSKTVLSWIGSGTRRYKPFVAHRVAEILAATDANDWRWIPSEKNVADEATRPSTTFDSHPTSRWLNGPSFLTEEEVAWPTSEGIPDLLEECEELRPKFVMLAAPSCVIDMTRFSSLTKLKRTVAWVIRFMDLCRHKKVEGCLNAEELKVAGIFLCRLAQSASYSLEINQLKEGGNVEKGSELYTLSPFIDTEGVMRVSGRIDAASWLPYDTTRPIILAPNHDLTRLLPIFRQMHAPHQSSRYARKDS